MLTARYELGLLISPPYIFILPIAPLNIFILLIASPNIFILLIASLNVFILLIAPLNVFIMLIAPCNSITHTERDVAFQPQISLRERSTTLRYAYIALSCMQFIPLKMIWIRTRPLYEFRKAGSDEPVLICTAAETWLQDKLIPHPCVEYLSQCVICEDYTYKVVTWRKKKIHLLCNCDKSLNIRPHESAPTAPFLVHI